ncbi:hypothetical protein BH09PLA1_BH09PLA1_00540 [soil metagenome]
MTAQPLATYPDAELINVLGVRYLHAITPDGGEIYLTEYGLPFCRQLAPENWYEPRWRNANSRRLAGSGTVYRLRTKPINGVALDLVIKWSRVGQELPANTFTLARNLDAEFNTPFEEIALLKELRDGKFGPRNLTILTQKPLAIYVPDEQHQLWQTGRSIERVATRNARHPAIDIDILRSYIMIYGWVDGPDAVEAYACLPASSVTRDHELKLLTEQIDRELACKGFIVADHKPSHFIVRLDGAQLKRRKDGRVAYALVDYELLSRTREYEQTVAAKKRIDFRSRLTDRFRPQSHTDYPNGLVPWNVNGANYIVGRSESTGGTLWVVGNDPGLFSYFLPERWRIKQHRLSDTNEVFFAHSKDQIDLVWRVSRVGELPPGTLDQPGYKQVLMQGYNSPFEEIALAREMTLAGIPASAPLAIYMTAKEEELGGVVLDERRFEALARVMGPDRRPILPMDHDYITLWAFWRRHENSTTVNIAEARRQDLIFDAIVQQLMQRQEATLAKAGLRDVRPSSQHLLLSRATTGELELHEDGLPICCQCNFEFLRGSSSLCRELE